MFARFVLLLLAGSILMAQELPVRWDELVASDWKRALELSKGTCLLPIGILEKHGPHVPVGSDLFHATYISREVAKREYVVVFPEYFYGQIYEAKYGEGTFALPPALISKLLQATLDEIARNGFKKILIYSTHGGNPHWLRFFVQSQLDKKRDYVVYYYDPAPDTAFLEQLSKIRKTPLAGDEHAGERETSSMLAIRPDLVKMDRAGDEDGSDQKRLADMPNIWTATSWYARFPNHYAGQGGAANKELGEFDQKTWSRQIAEAIKAVKADQNSLKLQNQFFEQSLHPLDTKQ